MTGARRALAPEDSSPRELAFRVGLVAVVVLLATGAAFGLQSGVGISDASPVYLIAVVVAASLIGTWAALATSVIAFLAYDFLFISPRLTLAVSDPAEWLSLLLFLIVAVVIGRLAALQRDRAEEADRRVREGVALVAMSHDAAMATTFEEAAAEIVLRLAVDAEMDAVWVEAAATPDLAAVPGPPGRVEAAEPPGRAVAWTGGGPPADPGPPWTLVRTAEDGGADWLRLHGGTTSVVDREGSPAHYVVRIDAGAEPAGWIHALRAPTAPRPGRGARRLLALAADQLAIAHRRDALRADLTAAEVARQSDALRGAILDAVSHDLRTPVASIRALAGGLADAAPDLDPAAVRTTAEQIDAEGQRLGGLVNGLLDMSRIQAGAIRPDLRPYDLAELVETALRHHTADRVDHPIEVSVPDTLPPVVADAVLVDVALGNVVDNAAAHSRAGTRIRVRAQLAEPGWATIDVDDAGPGVPDDALPRLFERFYRVRTEHEGPRHGMGLGLAIARGFVEAMGGTVAAAASDLGGLRIRIRLPVAPDEDERDDDGEPGEVEPEDHR